VPAAQLYFQTGWALDKHLSYGIWFAAIAAGYGCDALVTWLPGGSKRLAAACCVLALSFPAVSNWQLAWGQFHTWADGSAFVSAFQRAAVGGTSHHKLIYASGQEHVAQYYTPQGNAWRSWSAAGLSLNPDLPAGEALGKYYRITLRKRQYSVIALFYDTTFSAGAQLPGSLFLNSHYPKRYENLVKLVGSNTGQAGLSALTLALQQSRDYRLVSVGPYNITSLSGRRDYGQFTIWKLVSTQGRER